MTLRERVAIAIYSDSKHAGEAWDKEPATAKAIYLRKADAAIKIIAQYKLLTMNTENK